jgi:hypothetical protein
VLTDEERAVALARYQARLDALPPSAALAEEFTEPSRSAMLREARDGARVRPEDDLPPDMSDTDGSGVAIAHMSDVGCSRSENKHAGPQHVDGVNHP